MPIFPLLADCPNYRPCREDMLVEVAYRNHWLRYFEKHFKTVMVKLALEVYGAKRARDIQACCADLVRQLRALRKNPRLYGELNLLVLDLIRQQKLMEYELPDPFIKRKASENRAMLKVYPKVVAELDSHKDPHEAFLLLMEGIFAGNIFDMGVAATVKMFAVKSPNFLKVRDGLGGTRPWLVDHFDALAQRMLHGPRHKKAIIFADNAGSDIVLGVLPLARWLARRGTTVVLAANTLPALNDMTAHEMSFLCRQVAVIDPVFAALLKRRKIRVVASGGVAPLLDLRHLSPECNHEATDADLVILEGMGRGLESNYHAKFKCDAVKICMIKDKMVAKCHKGKVFDVVLRYDPA